MEKILKPVYEFTFNKNTFEYVAGNAAFYDFRGVNNIYDTMKNNLLVGESEANLRKMIDEENYTNAFTMHIADKNRNVSFVVCRLLKEEAEDVVGIRMIEMDRLFDEYNSLQLIEREADALLSQYDCVYYSYDRKSDEIVCYSYDMGKNMFGKKGLSVWQNEVKEKITRECHDAFDGFVTNLRNGTRNIECTVSDKADGKVTLFVGTAVYDEDVHLKTVGRMGDPNMVSSHELTRRDQLTGLFLKETITNYAKRRIDEQKRKTILAIIDIDDFKNVNDNFGHAKGDEVLKKCAAIIQSQSEPYGKAGRIGGDEFLVVFDKGDDFEGIKNVLRSIKNNVYSSYTDENDGFHVSTSIGLSVYPDDTNGKYETMFKLADCLLYRAKRKGKNRWIVYNREKHGAIEDVLSNGIQKVGLSDMRGIDKSELVCKITNMMICGTQYPIENILYDIMNYFAIERINLYNKDNRIIVSQLGDQLLSADRPKIAPNYIYNEDYLKMFDGGVLVLNNTKYFDKKIQPVYDELMELSAHSIMQFELKGESGGHYLLSLEAVKENITWNMSDMGYFRILTKVMEHIL